MVKGIVIAVVSLVVLLGLYFAIAYVSPVDLGNRTVSIIIEKGDGFSKIAGELLDNGVVSSSIMLKLPARWRDIDKKLTPGRYDFTGKNSCRSVLDKLERADFVNLRVTIYEGAPIWKVASILAERLELDSAEVVALNTDSLFLAELNLASLEGYLFPETYFFPWGTELRKVVTDMVSMYRQQTDSIWPEKMPNGLTREEIVILASIIEAEALLDDEKPTISSVYQNRIKKRMKLDADPTVIYGLGGLDRPLMHRDLRTATPYNTYMKRGLPPTPINSPGLTSIRAALHPEETDFLYFVADGTGRHRFSRTNAEHNRARRDIKRAQSN
jgi:UPF0755 protein